MLRGDPKAASNRAVIRPKLLNAPNLVNGRAKMGTQIEPSLLKRDYSKRNRVVKQIIPFSVDAPVRSSIAQAVYRTRKANGLSQAAFAEALGTLQGQVAKWETDALKPSGPMCIAMSRLATEADRDWWLAQAGLRPSETPVTDEGIQFVPLLRDSLAAGTPRAINKDEIERMLPLPASWFAGAGKLYAIRVTGDSMAPIIGNGYTVIVDVSRKEPAKLVERMVAASDGDGVTVKWLRKDGDMFLLVPNYTSLAHPIKIMRLKEGWEIVGLVVKWIGEPPSQPRKR